MLAPFRSWWRALTQRSRLDEDMAAEMDGHIERYAADLVARGVEPAEARRRARIEFGSVPAAAEECRAAVGLRWPDEFARNLRYAARVLRKSPTFTIAAVATLALCIGANTAIFSVVDAVLLRPLPYPQPDRLAAVARHYRYKGAEGDAMGETGRIWEAVRDSAAYLDSAVFSDGSMGVNFVAGGRVEYLRQQRISAGFFRVLGIVPLMGREFTRSEDVAGGPPVTVLSYALWKRAFGEDPHVLGRSVTLRGEPYTIVGVLPANFQSSTPADLWTPLRPSRNGEGGGWNYAIVARLRPGVTWAQADPQVEAVGAPIFHENGEQTSVRLHLIPFQRGLTDDLRRPLLILWAAVGLVLLIGCVNIAGLLLARAAGRSRELATRMALGCGRTALVRQLLAESILLGLCGGAAGAALGWLGVKALKLLAQDTLHVWQIVELDGRVLAATACASLLAGILFGLYPALAASRFEVHAALAEAGRGVAGARNPWPRRLLVAGEVALGVVLLVGAGLLIRTFAHLRGLNPGFDPRGVITASLSLQDARYATSRRVNRLFDQSLARMRELPGVESAAVVLTLPYQFALNSPFRRLDGPHVDTEYQITNMFYSTPDFFRVLRIPLLRGRLFSDNDNRDTAQVAIVSEAFVRMYLRGDDPLGRHLDFGGGDHREVIGVVGDIQQKSGWGEEFGPVAPMPAVYIPAAQTDDRFLQLVHTWFAPNWIVRASGPPEGIIAGMQRAVQAADPQLPFAGFHSMEDVRYRAFAQERFQAALLGSLAGLALLLSAVGIYGLIANSVAERTRELGIRLAMGATVAQAMRAVALPGVALAAAGVGAGCMLAAFASRLLRHLVWGVRPGDPLTFGAVGLVLLGVAALASLLPALRVLRLNPAETRRQE
jgi:predicted permease